ncbi:MAG TPA: aminotransferase class I/II-fold pyridoxal phosphate-dependent enzyme [Chitinophagaceae bacterium]|nr:aminotransferase class I/II-fold pyridoxal phosphate-dependent enzyme [Chitinophagaceae bacterium]
MPNRRTFLRNTGLSVLPFVAPVIPAMARSNKLPLPPERPVSFLGDSILYDPTAYIAKLQEINATQAIKQDFYGEGGAIAALERKFMEITGKERAMFMPTGTMANQFAILVLSGENTKVFVQETSHVFRDEADAAQSVHNKRLIPLAKGQAGFTAEELQQSVEYHLKEEVFKSGIGAVSIENPVRRADGKYIPFDELKKISAYCKQQGYKLHLDGARLHLAAAWSGVSIAQYASLFDTVYISLYKYLGASAGAILCGDKAVMDKMTHLMKIHGGAMFSNWTNAAMALHHVEGIEGRLQQAKKKSDELFAALNQLPELKVVVTPSGTNIHFLQPKGIDGNKMAATLAREHNIRISRVNESGLIRFTINESILNQDLNTIVNAFRSAIKLA